MNLALFDFDGTITKKDSLPDFLRFTFPLAVLVRGIGSQVFWLAGYKAGFVSTQHAKEKLLSRFFRNLSEEKFKTFGETYAHEGLPRIIRKSALAKIREHLQNGDRVVVVSASVAQVVGPFAREIGVEFLSTVMEVRDGLLTGKFLGDNCTGAEKVRRIKEAYDLQEYTALYAYGDSAGDREMLSLANFQFVDQFK